MPTILSNISIIRFKENQVHIEKKNKTKICELPIVKYALKNNMGAVEEILVHECNICKSKFIEEENVKKLKKSFKNIDIRDLSFKDNYASEFDVIVQNKDVNENQIAEVSPKKKKTKKQKRQEKMGLFGPKKEILKRSFNIEGNSKLFIVNEKTNISDFLPCGLIFIIGYSYIGKEGLYDAKEDKIYISKLLYDTFIEPKKLNCQVYFNGSIIYNKNKAIKNIQSANTSVEIKKGPKEKDRSEQIEFLIKGNSFRCNARNHNIEEIDAEVDIVNKATWEITPYKTNAYYCKNCHLYFMFESNYQKLIKHGIPACPIYEEKEYFERTNNFEQFSQESLMHSFGYNVNAQTGPSEKSRRKIISSLIESGIMDKTNILSHLDFLISTRESMKPMKQAVEKWKNDYNYTNNLNVVTRRKVNVGAFRLKKI